MPININKDLPAATTLAQEGIFVMTDERASTQDIRPLKIAILNLMPTKVTTETQLLRLLGTLRFRWRLFFFTLEPMFQKTFLQSISTPFINPLTISAIRKSTASSSPVLPSKCWSLRTWTTGRSLPRLWNGANPMYSAQCTSAGRLRPGCIIITELKSTLSTKKVFGVFRHWVLDDRYQLTRGFDDCFYAPHSATPRFAARISKTTTA